MLREWTIQKNAQDTTFDTKSNPNLNLYPNPDAVPTHFNFVRKKSGV